MKYIILISSIFIFMSCDSQGMKYKNHKILVDKILSENSDSLVLDDGIILFCKSNTPNKIGYITLYELNKAFNNDIRYQDLNYKDFVSDIINLKLNLDCDDMIECFEISDTIKAFYDHNNFSQFLLNYCDTEDNKEYRVKNNLSYHSQLSVIYYLFQNNYYTIFTDLTGFYYSNRIDRI